MSLGIWQIAIIAVLVVLLFGRGKISELMGDVAKGITSFKKGLKEDDSAVDVTPTINASTAKDSEKQADKAGS